MKNSIPWKLSAAFAGLAGCLSLSFSAPAAVPAGALEGADEFSVYGWVWDSDSYNHIIPVEITISPAGSSQILKTGVIKADDYQDKLQESIGDGYHGFLYPVDWSQFDQTEFRVTAYTAEDESVFLGELTYNKETRTCAAGASETARSAPSSSEGSGSPGPGGPGAASPKQEGSSWPEQESRASSSLAGQTGTASDSPGQKAGSSTEDRRTDTAPAGEKKAGDTPSSSSGRSQAGQEIGPGIAPPEPPQTEPEYISLGMFATTGYCNCEKCCSGSNLTYSGTVPQANHTISADISIFPIGTKLMINDIIYTVEDIGSSVIGNKLDIFYATHQEAEDHGVRQVEVFAVPEEPAS